MLPDNVQVRTESLENIADSIRTKNGTETKYKVGEMSGAIDELPIYNPERVMDISSNGEYNVGEYGKVDVDVPSSVSGTTTITSNGTHNVATYEFADVNVPSSASGTTQITTNGTHNVAVWEYAEVNVPQPSGTTTLTANDTYDVTSYATAIVNVPEPSGSTNITINGTHNVKDYAYANVQVPQPSGSTTITTNGTHDVYNYQTAIVDVPQPTGSTTITTNGTYDVTNYASAIVDVPSTPSKSYIYDGTRFLSINWANTNLTMQQFVDQFDYTYYKNAQMMFQANTNYSSTSPIFPNEFKPTNCSMMFDMYNVIGPLVTINVFDTSQCTNMNQMFRYHYSIEDLPEFDTTSCTNMQGMFLCNYNQGLSYIKFTNDSWNNLLAMCYKSAITSSKTLTNVFTGLGNLNSTDKTTLATRLQGLSNWTAFVNSGWTLGW